MSGLSDTEREALCICPWDAVGPTPDATHEHRCTRHMEQIVAREAELRERIAAALKENLNAGNDEVWPLSNAYDRALDDAAKIVRETP